MPKRKIERETKSEYFGFRISKTNFNMLEEMATKRRCTMGFLVNFLIETEYIKIISLGEECQVMEKAAGGHPGGEA